MQEPGLEFALNADQPHLCSVDLGVSQIRDEFLSFDMPTSFFGDVGCFRFPGQSSVLFLDRLLGFKFDRRRVAQ